jgi:hypothetical protein
MGEGCRVHRGQKYYPKEGSEASGGSSRFEGGRTLKGGRGLLERRSGAIL